GHAIDMPLITTCVRRVFRYLCLTNCERRATLFYRRIDACKDAITRRNPRDSQGTRARSAWHASCSMKRVDIVDAARTLQRRGSASKCFVIRTHQNNEQKREPSYPMCGIAGVLRLEHVEDEADQGLVGAMSIRGTHRE